MTDIYRPLYVLVEAVEAEIKRLLPPPEPTPRFDSGPTVDDYQKGLRTAFMDDSICVHRMPGGPVMMVLHRCKVCNELHRTRVDEIAMTKHIFIERLVNATRKLLESSCDIELRTP